MSEREDLPPATGKNSNGTERGSNRVSVTWKHLSKEKREQIERIEKRVREKMERGEL